MKPIVRVKNVSKYYRLGELRRPKRLVDWFGEKISRAAREEAHRKHADLPEEIWALKDVSFDVMPGEVVGIIGRNGAGKSTLLKILSRITEPSEGEVELFGRVSSLLEVGTGFHPELTGRDNVYLNGSILGLKRAEIDAKFDEIVDFAGVERFLDTPVKRYSSGMQMRLAFAVAAHLEPEILIVDEVLAVGDAEFQRKCIGKMGDVAKSGRTILFVSHNMAAVENLCSAGILLQQGEVIRLGQTSDVIRDYISGVEDELSGEIDISTYPCKALQLKWLRMIDGLGRATASVRLASDLALEVAGCAPSKLTEVRFNFRVDAMTGQRVAACPTRYQYPNAISLSGDFTIRCHLKNIRLMPGRYALTLIIHDVSGRLAEVGPTALEVVDADVYKTGRPPEPQTGSYVPEASWTVATESAPVS